MILSLGLTDEDMEGFDIDHIDRRKDNNKLDNLRLVSKRFNLYNREFNGCENNNTKILS